MLRHAMHSSKYRNISNWSCRIKCMSVFASNEVNSVFTLFRYFLFYQRSKKYYFATHRCKERDVDTVDWTPATVVFCSAWNQSRTSSLLPHKFVSILLVLLEHSYFSVFNQYFLGNIRFFSILLLSNIFRLYFYFSTEMRSYFYLSTKYQYFAEHCKM